MIEVLDDLVDLEIQMRQETAWRGPNGPQTTSSTLRCCGGMAVTQRYAHVSRESVATSLTGIDHSQPRAVSASARAGVSSPAARNSNLNAKR